MRFLGLLFSAILLTFGPWSSAQVLEEATTLESIYEARARALLNTMVRPNEYSVVVSAELNRDKKKLDAYREEVDMRFLPGMPLPGSPDMMPENNVLHEMKASVAVNVVLVDTISADKEEIIKKLLISKLKLDVEGGDSILVSRMKLTEEAAPTPDLLPDFTWRTWALIILLALIALAGLVFWRHQKKSKEKTQDQPSQAPLAFPFEPPKKNGEDEKDKVEDGPSRRELEAKKNEEERRRAELLVAEISKVSDLILSVSSGFPMLACQALSLQIAEGFQEDVTLLCDHLGWDVARRLYPHINYATWSKLGQTLKARASEPTDEQLLQSLVRTYRAVLAKVLEMGGDRDDVNPFSFLFKLTASERDELLAVETESNLALVGLFMSSDQMAEVLQGMPTIKASRIVAEMARLEKLPSQAVDAAAKSLSSRLMKIRNEGNVHAHGPQIVAELLRGLPADLEIEVMDQLQSGHVHEMAKLRKVRLQFADIVLLPRQLVAPAIEKIDAETLTRALTGCDSQFISQMVDFLPVKKGNMILGDLQAQILQVSKLEIGMARRKIVTAVDTQLVERKLNLAELLKDGEGAASAAEESSAA